MPGPIETNTATSNRYISPDKRDDPSEIQRPKNPVARHLEGGSLEGLRDLNTRRASTWAAKAQTPLPDHSFLDMHDSFLDMDDSSSSLSLADSRPVSPKATNIADVEQMAIHPTYVDGLQTSAYSKAHAIAAEFVAKFAASGIHFGLARQYTDAAAESWLAHMAASHPTAKAIADNPLARAAITALVTAPALASAHHVGEVYVRPLVLKAFGAQVVPTRAEAAFGPDDTSARDHMKAQQTAGKIGKAPADLIGLASFGIANGVRGVLGGVSPLATSLTSAIAGGTMAGAHSVMNLNTRTEASDGSFDAPTHHVSTVPLRSVGDVGDVIVKSFRSVAGNGPIPDQIANTLQDIFGARGIAALQGLLIAGLVKAQATDSPADAHPTNGQKFGQAAAASVALLGLAFFANLSLAARRGKTSGPMSGSIGALKSLDPGESARDGGMRALMEAKSAGVGARVWNAALTVADVAAHTGKTLQTLPGHVVLDTMTLVGHGAK